MKWTISIISSNPPAEKAMPNLQHYPWKLWQIKYELWYPCFYFFKRFKLERGVGIQGEGLNPRDTRKSFFSLLKLKMTRNFLFSTWIFWKYEVCPLPNIFMGEGKINNSPPPINPILDHFQQILKSFIPVRSNYPKTGFFVRYVVFWWLQYVHRNIISN